MFTKYEADLHCQNITYISIKGSGNRAFRPVLSNLIISRFVTPQCQQAIVLIFQVMSTHAQGSFQKVVSPFVGWFTGNPIPLVCDNTQKKRGAKTAPQRVHFLVSRTDPFVAPFWLPLCQRGAVFQNGSSEAPFWLHFFSE